MDSKKIIKITVGTFIFCVVFIGYVILNSDTVCYEQERIEKFEYCDCAPSEKEIYRICEKKALGFSFQKTSEYLRTEPLYTYQWTGWNK